LNQVIFGYVGKNQRYGNNSLEDLITYLSNQTSADIAAAKTLLHEANLKVVSLEKKLVPDYKQEIDQKSKLKQADIDAHVASRPTVVPKPPEGGDDAARSAAEIKDIDEALENIGQRTHDLQSESEKLARVAEDLRQTRQTLERQVNALTGLKTKYEKLLQAEGIAFGDLVEMRVSYAKLDDAIQTKEARLDEIAELLRDATHIVALGLGPEQEKIAREKSLSCQKSALEERRKEITDKLDKPNRDYQTYLIADDQWQARKQAIEGAVDDPLPETLNWLKRELDAITTKLPEELRLAQQERAAASKAVLSKKKSLIGFYDSVKRSIDDEIKRYGADLGQYNISIEASLKFDPQFYDAFLGKINQHAKGSFHGTDDGRRVLQKNNRLRSSLGDRRRCVERARNK
jgi:chromosome segregation ATPase